MQIETKKKLVHYEQDFDYPIPGQTNDSQANILASNIINQFLHDYDKLFKTKSFIYIYNDDLYSLVGYRILCNIAELSDFKFSIYGKPKKTKKFVAKSNRVLSKRIFNSLKDEAIIISSFNPIYNVLKIKTLSNEFEDTFSIVRKITPNELFAFQKFYNFPNFSDTQIHKSNFSITAFQNWLAYPFSHTMPPALDHPKPIYPINLIWIENNEDRDEALTQKNIEVLNEVEQADGLNFYYYINNEPYINTTPFILNDLNYQLAVKHKTNIPSNNYKNMNHYQIPVELITEFHVPYKFYGDWPDVEKAKMNRYIELGRVN